MVEGAYKLEDEDAQAHCDESWKSASAIGSALSTCRHST